MNFLMAGWGGVDNPDFGMIEVGEGGQVEIWGVVTWVVSRGR